MDAPAFAARGDSDIIGTLRHHVVADDETLYKIARPHSLAFSEIMGANPGIDPWVPPPGKKLLLPTRYIIPEGKREGLLINLAEMRLYHFPEDGSPAQSFPIGIGRYEWATPLGRSKVIRKQKDPAWYVPQSIREENPKLPAVVPPGPNNPLGGHAIYLNIPGYLLHGTNKPWGIGLRVTHGCIRLYPEDVASLYEQVGPGTKVQIVDQPVKAGWNNGEIYVEVHAEPDYAPEENSSDPLPRKSLYPLAAKVLQRAAGVDVGMVDWDAVRRAVQEATGVPVKAMRRPGS